MERGLAPAWACAWGEDEYGVFASFRVGEAVQRMRWVEAGTFVMGSPESEEGRFDDEGPQHAVTFSSGYWVADTPCTQQLWVEVMGDNPSEFQSSQRPVEQVSWEDATRFIGRLNTSVRGLDASLPTEAQWEHACRAGAEAATYAGELDILGERNAPVLDAIAWYGGNSGLDYELERGWDTSDGKQMQYPRKRAGTRVVAQKKPNAWGLYDMLGNVYEWCGDNYEPYTALAVTDPIGTPGVSRVFRGGSWGGRARSVRAARRYRVEPGYRNDNLGFRLIRGQGLRQPEQQASSSKQGPRARARDDPGDGPAGSSVVEPAQGRRTPAPPPARTTTTRQGRVEMESAEPDQPPGRYVLLRVAIGPEHYEMVSMEEIQKFADLPDIAETHTSSRTLDLRVADDRDWREIAKDLDRLLNAANHAAQRSLEPVTFVIAGTAPLPVFTYLGYRSKQLKGRVMLLNKKGDRWDRIGPFSGDSDFPDSTRQAFKVGLHQQLRTTPGVSGLFIGCSSDYRCGDDALHGVAGENREALSALYRIDGLLDYSLNPLNEGDLASLSRLLLTVLEKIAQDPSRTWGLVVAIAGPAWVAFWVGRMLTGRVGSIEMPQFVAGAGYRRALTVAVL